MEIHFNQVRVPATNLILGEISLQSSSPVLCLHAFMSKSRKGYAVSLNLDTSPFICSTYQGQIFLHEVVKFYLNIRCGFVFYIN
jgi:hypothetical protein